MGNPVRVGGKSSRKNLDFRLACVPTMKHGAMAAITFCLAIAITFRMSTYGADGVLGFIAVYGGYPGGFVNWRLNPGHVSYLLITAINWLIYFAIAEALFTVLSRFSGQKS